MTGLPQGWALAPINTFARSRSGNSKLIKGQQAQEPASGLFPAFSASGQDVWVAHPEHEGNAIIISAVGARCGKTFRATGQWSAVANTHIVWPEEIAVDTDWLQLLLNDENFWEKGGSAQPFVKVNATFEREIPLPPLPEQRRIVHKLDTLSARSTTARTHLTAIEKLVERYKLAVLRSAFFVDASGTLDEEEAAACGWDVRPLGQSLENLDNRRIPIKAEDRKKRQGPYDYYGASGVIDKIDEYLFDGRYLLIGEDGANLVARSSPIAFIAEGQFWVNNHAHILGETHDACLDWVRLYFAAIKLEPFVTGSAQPKLTQANLNKIPVPLPTPEEQREIVRRIETAFAKIDRLKAEAAKALKLLGHLDQRILAKAFAGDLVPQDPTDEPAETLLARIREARAAAPKSRRGRK